MQEITFIVIDNVLYRMDYQLVLLRCVEPNQSSKILQKIQDGVVGGHSPPINTTLKVMIGGYF